MMGKYMLIIQRAAGLSPTIVTSDDKGFLEQEAEKAKLETRKTLSGKYYNHDAKRIRIIEIRWVYMDWTPEQNILVTEGA